MARAHASGILVREGSAPDITRDEPRVVIAVETDARKVPTHPRLVEGRDSSTARAPLLPEAQGEETAARRAESAPAAPARQRTPAWARAALVLALLVVVVGIGHQARSLAEPVRIAPRLVAMLDAAPRPLPPSPPPQPAPAIAIAIEDLPAAAPVAATRPRAPAAPRARRTPPAPRDAPAPAGAKAPDFLPPFELPAEKKHD